MNIIKNKIIDGQHNKPIALDAYFKQNQTKKPIIIFVHGFKGFKDWGHFNLLAKTFANAGFCFIKFNFSHNGTSPEHLTEFVDLEAFGNNNFSKELDDLGSVIDWTINNSDIDENEIDKSEIYLVGHSRGGGIAILKAYEDARIKKLVVWASVNEYGKFWSKERMERWKSEGVMYIDNLRTKQKMPLYYQLYDDYFANLDRLHIPTAVKKLQQPFLIIHGTKDEAVPHEDALAMHSWNKNSKMLTIENGTHVFGGKHPYTADILPEDSQKVVDASIAFFKSQNKF